MIARRRRTPTATPWREARWCAVDLELTGLDPRHDEIVAIGAVPIDGAGAQLGRSLYTPVRSARRSAPEAVVRHRLRVADLRDAPSEEEALDALLPLLGGRVPVFHTAAVERAFLGRLLGRRRVRLPEAADTEVLGRLWLQGRGRPAPAGLPLARLARELRQPAEPAHHALGDACTTAQAFIALATHLERLAPQTVGTLVRAGDRLRGARRLAA